MFKNILYLRHANNFTVKIFYPGRRYFLHECTITQTLKKSFSGISLMLVYVSCKKQVKIYTDIAYQTQAQFSNL